ncbi:putative O-methyltransferase [Xylariomycetidae sp. FL2044]|nr:putative O-methyltransferase [Xylariomycetidae sp. FL2044]
MSCEDCQAGPGQGVCLSSLGRQISALSSEICAYFSRHGSPRPTFDSYGGEFPEDAEYEAIRASLNDVAVDLLTLVNGPKITLRDMFFSHYDLAAMQVALDRHFFHHIPLPSDIADGHSASQGASRSVVEIAAKSGMDEGRTGALLKLLVSRRILQQVKQPGSSAEHFKHTSLSASLVRDAEWHALGDMKLDDMFKASSQLSAAISRSPNASDANRSAFQHCFGMPIYQYYEQDPERGKRFSQAMSSWSKVNEKRAELRDSFPWGSLGDGKVVDVGGGSGHISMNLAREFPSLRFVVQDRSTVQLGHNQDHHTGRVSFQQHDFFSPQPVHDASAFLLRQILHNYHDEDGVRIIRALVPALEKCSPETPVLVNEIILPGAGTVTKFEEHLLRQADVSMMVVLGAKQRSREDWDRLFKDADQRFEIVNTHANPLGLGMLRVHLIRDNTPSESK